MKTIAAIVALFAVAGCQPGPQNPRPVPSVTQIGSELNCPKGDHGFSDLQAGWGFCYPGTWKYTERANASQSPPGLDLTFDITDVPCTVPSAAPGGPSAKPECGQGAGLFAFMVVSTYERGGLSSLTAWQGRFLPSAAVSENISWGNAVEAAKLVDGRRIALTPRHVVVLELRQGQGTKCLNGQGQPTPCYLDLDTPMGMRLKTWKFTI